MLRRLIIGLGALGLVLVVYGLYRSHNPPPARPTTPIPTITLAPAATSAPATQQRSLPGLANVKLAPGGQTEFKVFDPKGQLQYLLQWDEYIPSGEDAYEIHVAKPSLSKFMRDGQILQITASEGQIHVEPAGKGQFKPKHGTLSKDVEIRIDLTTRQWRLSHPGQEAMDQHPQHIIHIEMDSLYFDDDLSLIRTEGPVKVRSEKFDIDAQGLRLVYSRPQDRLEHLEVLQGGTIELRDAVDLETSPLLAGSRTALRTAAATRPQPQATAAATSPADGEPVAEEAEAPASAPAAPRFVDVYQARFEGPVHMQQFRGQQTVARLDADRLLDLTFDLGPQGRQNAAVPDDPGKSADQASATQPAGTAETNRVVMTWAGRLDINAIQRRSPDKASRTTIIRAVGEKVVLADQENSIECSELQYDAVRRSGRILAPAPAMARIADARGRYLAGHDIRFDQSGMMTGTLEIVGAGEAAEPATGQLLVSADAKAAAEGPMRIEWQKGLSMRFRRGSLSAALSLRPLLPPQLPDKHAIAALAMYQGVFEIPQTRVAQSLGAGPMKGLVAQTARITGNALVQRGEESICSEELDIEFYPAAGEGQVFGPIHTAKGAGGVSLVSQAGSADKQSRSITSDQLDVQFERVSADRSNPTRALAIGKAVVVQDSAKVEADHIDATLSPVAETVPAEPTATSRPARSKTQPKVAVSDLLATGNVRITDSKRPQNNLVAHRLKASIDSNQTISQVQVDGSPEQLATVSTSEYSITAPSIQGDLRTEDVTVPSGGELTLYVKQDLQGQQLSKAQPLTITWTDHMRMWGDKNLAEFVGRVQAVQTNATTGRRELDFAGDRMQVYLRPADRTAVEAPAAPTAPQRLANLLDKARNQFAEVFPASEGWGPSHKAADRSPTPSPAGREPIKIVAEGNAMATMPRYDEAGKVLTSRLLIVGPRFEVNLERQQLEVEGKGNLLVENYALAALANDPRASDPEKVIAEARSRPDSGLSQTVFTWHNVMVYILPERTATFDEQVNMIHLAGGRIRFGEELASALGAKLELLKRMPGRDATLNCDTLCVQFSETLQKDSTQDSQWMQRSKLAILVADGKLVSLEEHLSNGGTNMVTAGRLQYNGQRDTFVVQRSANSPAKIVQQKDASAISQTHEANTIYWERNSSKGPGHDRLKVQNLRGTVFQ